MTSHVTSWKGDIASFSGIKWSRMNENSGSRCEKNNTEVFNYLVILTFLCSCRVFALIACLYNIELSSKAALVGV